MIAISKRILLPFVCAAVAWSAVVTLSPAKAGIQSKRRPKAPTKAGKGAKPASKPAAPTLPADREAAVVVITRTVLSQILQGKVEPALLTPAMRAKLTPAKTRSMRTSLREFGGLQTVKLVDRKDRSDSADVCTLRVVLGETTFIATVAVTKENKVDDLQLLEE